MAAQKKVDRNSTGKEMTLAQAPTGVIQAPADQVPDYIRQDSNRGNENVGTEDLVIPRLELVQALSPCLDENNEAAYIEGAKQGQLFNSLTRELYGSSVLVVPVMFMKQYLVWRDRKKGGGFGGAFNSIADAKDEISRREDPENWEPVETGQHLVLIIKANGALEEAMISMSRTKLKISRQWNSLIRQGGGDRFSRVYQITGVKETNSNNDTYFNFSVKFVGFPSQDIYERASELYERIAGGDVNVVMDTSYVDEISDREEVHNDEY